MTIKDNELKQLLSEIYSEGVMHGGFDKFADSYVMAINKIVTGTPYHPDLVLLCYEEIGDTQTIG